MVRSYVATGDSKFEDFFWDILAIRDGKKSRPINYERVYWDFMTVKKPAPPLKEGGKVPLKELMREAGFREKEFQMLADAKKKSDKLVSLEKIAMHVMKGKFQDEKGEFSISGEPDPEMAKQIVFGKEYHEAKRSIMEPINEFFGAIDQRTSKNVTQVNSQIEFYQGSLFYVFGALILNGLFLLLTTNRHQKLLVDRLKTSIDQQSLELTDRKRAEKALQKANIHLQEMDRVKSVFLASMSHELRTPLNSIIGFTGVILRGMAGAVNEEQRKQLVMVENSAAHLLSLINDVLDISKVEAGKVELSLEEFGLKDVVIEVIETLLPTANAKGLALVTEVPEDTTLFSDSRRVKQVLINLVGNAVKFTKEGSVKIAAEAPRDGNLQIRVVDTGMGIKEEDMDRLFQPFQRVGVSRTETYIEGTGLGLNLSKKLVTLLG